MLFSEWLRGHWTNQRSSTDLPLIPGTCKLLMSHEPPSLLFAKEANTGALKYSWIRAPNLYVMKDMTPSDRNPKLSPKPQPPTSRYRSGHSL